MFTVYWTKIEIFRGIVKSFPLKVKQWACFSASLGNMEESNKTRKSLRRFYNNKDTIYHCKNLLVFPLNILTIGCQIIK